MSLTCRFELTRDSSIYYSGEVIEGTVTLYPFKQRQVEAILLKFYGHTKVAWLDLDKTAAVTNDNVEQIMLNDFSSKELWTKTLYSDQQKHVSEQLQLASQHLLQPHHSYKYKFCFLIPPQTAATSHCPLGECEYGLQVIVQQPKKVNKEFHHRIVVKNKLDLSQNIALQQSCSISNQNALGIIEIWTPCTGFTPGQKIPYQLKCKTSQTNCKISVQLNCLTICRSRIPRNNLRYMKETINQRKHTLGETMGHISIPLDCHISRGSGCEDLIMTFEYHLQALIIDCNKRVLLTVDLPLTLGTTPCFKLDDEDVEILCYDNYAHSETHFVKKLNVDILKIPTSLSPEIFGSVCLLPLKRRTQLRRSLKYCYKKIVKFI
ncbi:uncharacterized protein LOC142220080 isoform X2 [Haematobia irritans]|uniref:uncharacterized protein LOC142220080 isoform X2 n=1 Tax=Haematobia irritans TaxID=7368 RepID=UPI003F50D0D9